MNRQARLALKNPHWALSMLKQDKSNAKLFYAVLEGNSVCCLRELMRMYSHPNAVEVIKKRMGVVYSQNKELIKKMEGMYA